jgi:hypothetical protein
MNGDGAVNMTDFNLYRPKIGTVLPAVPSSPASPGSRGAVAEVAIGAIDDEDFPGPFARGLRSATITDRQRTRDSSN